MEIRRVKKIEVNLMLRVRNRRSHEFQIGERKMMVLHGETINYNFLAKYFNMVIIERGHPSLKVSKTQTPDLLTELHNSLKCKLLNDDL